MRDVIQAMKIVFNDKRNVVVGMFAAFLFGAIFIVSSGMLTFFPEGPFIEINPSRFITLITLVILSGLVVPMQWYAIQKARAGLRTSTSTFGGVLVGIATMSCCTPLLLPAILSFIGFSGTQLLVFNLAIRQYILPLSLFSIGLLFISLFMISRSVVAACRLENKRKV